MKDDVLQRAMFAGNMAAPPPVADGVGITSGLDAPMPMPETPPQDMQQTLTGLEQVGGMIQNMQQGVDSAEDFESMMNAMRSDEQPIEARRAELAGMVGDGDATATPESVLTLLQPTFEMLETLEQSVPQGGIGGIAMGEDVSRETMMPAPPMPPDFPSASSEYIQAPGTEEAMARMAMGEQPVNRAFGSPIDGEQNQYLRRAAELIAMPTQGRIEGGIDKTPRLPEFTYGQGGVGSLIDLPENNETTSTVNLNLPNKYVYGTTPDLVAEINPETVSRYASMYENELRKRRGEVDYGETDPAALFASQQKLLSPYLTAPRTKEDILAEQQEFFGTADQDALKTQTGLALAKYFSQVPGEGTLLQNLVRPAGAFAEDLSKVTAQKAAMDRQAKEFAYTTAQEETLAEKTQNLQVMQGAITQATANATTEREAKDLIAQEAARLGITFAEKEQKIINENIKIGFQANLQSSLLASKLFVKVDENGVMSDPITVRTTQDGLRTLDANGDILDKVPEGYVPYQAGMGALPTSAIKVKKAIPSILVPDSTSLSGYRSVPGVVSESGNFYISRSGGTQQLAPAGFKVGKQTDIFKVEALKDGRVYMVYKDGPYMGDKIMVGIARRADNSLPSETDLQALTGSDPDLLQENAQKDGIKIVPLSGTDLMHQLKPAVYKTNEETGLREYRGGDPLVSNLGRTSLDPAQLTESLYNEAQRKIVTTEQALTDGQRILDSIPFAMGPGNTAKSVIGNNLAMFFPGVGDEFATWTKVEQNAQAMNLFGRRLIAALALNPRYPVGEMKLLEGFSENPVEFFSSPTLGAVRFQEAMRLLTNELAYGRAQISGDNVFYQEMVPTGTKENPFIYGKRGHYEYLTLAANRPNANLNGTVLRMTAKEAIAAGIEESTIGGRQFIDLTVDVDPKTREFIYRKTN